MQGRAPFLVWLSDPRNQQVAELLWSIKMIEAQLFSLLESQAGVHNNQKITVQLEYCSSLYQKLSHFYPPAEIPTSTHSAENNTGLKIIEHWQHQSHHLRQCSNGDEKACCIASILDSLNKLILLQNQPGVSPIYSHSEQYLSQEALSQWFLSLIDLIRHQQDNPAWANDFFQQLTTSAYHELYKMLTHPDTAHFMFHVYYYKLYPDQLSQISKHPNLLVSIDQRLSFLYQRIEQFVETFILFSKNNYHILPKNFLCHGNHLPNGIALRSKETYRQLIVEGLKKLNTKASITAQTPTLEIIDAFFRSYQFWFNPSRILDAIYMICKRLELSIDQPDENTLFHHMYHAFQTLEIDACIHLYGYFSNNDTRYLLRILYFIGNGGSITQIPSLSENQQQLVHFLYQAFMQTITALSETLNEKNMPCNSIDVTQSSKPPNPSKRNIQAIMHVISTYSETGESTLNLESLFAELEKG